MKDNTKFKDKQKKIISELLISKEEADEIRKEAKKKGKLKLKKSEARNLVYWLDEEANHKWRKGGHIGIARVYNKLNIFLNSQRRWQWKKYKLPK